MPDVIGTDSLSGVNVAANYLKATYPYSKFGTRELTFVNVDVANIETNPGNADSVFAQVVRAMQQVAEIYYVGTPASSGVVFIVASDTLVNSTDSNSQTIAEAMTAGGLTATVTTATGFSGNSISFA